MRCDVAQEELSARFDGEWAGVSDDRLDGHLAGCRRCQAWVAHVGSVRHAVRFEVAGAVPDIAGAVLARLPAAPARVHQARRRPRRRAWLPAVAALVVGIVIGATVVSGMRPGSPPSLVEADIPGQVAAAQVNLTSLTASVQVRERNWHRDVPVRTYSGRLDYRAPESLDLELSDTTRYPSGAWRPNDVSLVVDGSRYWQRGLFGCPADAQPACTPPAPRVRAVTGREPFAEDGLGPLELVLPASAFRVGETATVIEGRREVAGREAIGVLTTAAQVDGLLSGLRQAGNWRAVHPADPVELWLDAAALVPLSVGVRAGSGVDRERWAQARGYPDHAGDQILAIELGDVRLNGPVAHDAFPAAPDGAVTADAGFREGTPQQTPAPLPAWLPPGMVPARSGVVDGGGGGGPDVAVGTWTDGRAWIKVSSTAEWQGGRLFGDVGPAPATVALGGTAGTAYAAGAGDRVALHAAGLDVVVTGSLPAAVLERVAASLGVRGRPVPPSWAEAGAVTLEDAAGVASTPLLVAHGLSGYGPPSVRVDGGTVTLSYAGAGIRAFRVVERPGTVLTPPAGADVRGVAVRGTTGRFTPSLGLLEWVESGTTVVGVESVTLSLADLVDVAEGLRAGP